MDKLHDSRKQFEEWLKFHSDEEECTNLLQMNNAGTNYLHPHTDLAWIAWKESRASIVVELPQRQSLCASGYGDGYFVPSDFGEGLEYDETVEAIRSIGLSIKGEVA